MYTTLIREGVLYEELSLEEVVQKLKGYAWNIEDQASDFEKIQDPQLYKASKPVNKDNNGGVMLPYIQKMKPLQGMYSSSRAQKSQATNLNIPKLDPSCLKLIEENMSLLASFMMANEKFCLGKLLEQSSLDKDFDQIDQDEMEELDLQLNRHYWFVE
ncbi:hypothetical protein Hanom_Chr03g00214541 [Helianthus anomalus]